MTNWIWVGIGVLRIDGGRLVSFSGFVVSDWSSGVLGMLFCISLLWLLYVVYYGRLMFIVLNGARAASSSFGMVGNL